jgi:hypothetical protein
VLVTNHYQLPHSSIIVESLPIESIYRPSSHTYGYIVISLHASFAATIETSSIMALNSFFHNKIESMKLEIIQRNSKLRRLEAQRNDYNSRGMLERLYGTTVALLGAEKENGGWRG